MSGSQSDGGSSDDKQLERVYDYAKFHIGLYTVVLGGVVGLTFTDAMKKAVPVGAAFAVLTVVTFCFAGAGFCGGVVASSVHEFTSYRTFMETPIGPEGRIKQRPDVWLRREHRAFWTGVGVLILALVALTAQILLTAA